MNSIYWRILYTVLTFLQVLLCVASETAYSTVLELLTQSRRPFAEVLTTISTSRLLFFYEFENYRKSGACVRSVIKRWFFFHFALWAGQLLLYVRTVLEALF